MNNNSEQLTFNMSLVVAQDQPLRGNALYNAVLDRLGSQSTMVTMYGKGCQI